ncbi:molecular chaperone TorD [Paramagnetospirillum marisnigri]|uniref:Molecular chaperone TorD n=1 Tax=Paramagnetospirillum marisnigri TaxID=1285242 RepID=A0A178M7W1_9PROT|nr:molecular chaperone TorD family protein [Paramagnetospirillum marisnigri]OAN44849.1 molecular chaperone TorD [Paramagnetospirillum marisnigri]
MQVGNTARSIAEEDFLRARFYGLLSTLLAAPPPDDLLARLAHLEPDATSLGTALGELARAAAGAEADAVAEEYQALFIGVTGGELVPYGSWYLTGFLHEKPLAELRADMVRLGLEASPGTSEPEDHVASLLEMMQGLITGLVGEPLSPAEQKRFFDTHMAPWIPRFMTDLERAESARFYRAVAQVGRVFLDIETQAFAMVD